MRLLTLTLILLALAAAPAAGQRLVIEGDSRHPAAEMLREIAERNLYLVIDRDTVLPADSRVDSDLVIVDATVRLEGEIAGSVAVLGGTFFIRPGAQIGGVSVAVSGIIGMSALATVGDTLSVPPEHRVAIERSPGEYRVRITPPNRPRFVRPQGAFGVILPSYDRVNGVTVRAGVGGGIGVDSLRPRYSIIGSYYSARGAVGVTGMIRFPLGDGISLEASGGREVRTSDAWIRGDLQNSISTLFVRSDMRDYHQSDFGMVALRQTPPIFLDPGQGYLLPHFALTASHDRSLRTRNVWSLFGDAPWRENPEVFEGVLTSAIGGFSAGWQGRSSGLRTVTDVEWAFPSPVGENWGERTFGQVTTDAAWTMGALWRHTLAIRGRAMLTFGPEAAPPQRWSMLGGPSTLPTFSPAALRGDNLVFLQTTYVIPVRPVTVPVLGMPELVARHAVGSAWVTGDEGSRRWEQNLIAGIRFGIAEFLVSANPADEDLEPTFDFSFRLPF